MSNPDILRMELFPLRLDASYRDEFLAINPAMAETLTMSTAFYTGVGYELPWVGYFAYVDDVMIGSCGFKGPPRNGKVEIAYGTLPGFERCGVATQMCKTMTEIALKTAPFPRITARTLEDNQGSIGVLKKNGYTLLGKVWDEDDGEVLEWEYIRPV